MRRLLASTGPLACFAPVLLFSLLGFLAMGYHPGAEDDGVYLAAVKADLNPALYPHDGEFFRVQMRASIFDNWMADFVRATGIPLSWSELLWQAISIVVMLWACWSIVCRLFQDAPARWGGVAMVGAMLTLPVAGTALYIADQYLHPRNPASALILLAVARILARRSWQAVPMLCLAAMLHPLMGAFGISFCCVLVIADPLQEKLTAWRNLNAASKTGAACRAVILVPFGWLFARPSQAWVNAMETRHWFRLYGWTWYEWLGAVGPLVLFWVAAKSARRRGHASLARFATAGLIYGLLQQALAMIVLAPQRWIVFSTLEPMRYLHLVYIFMALIGGAYLGRFVLKAHAWRWAAFLVVGYGSMFAVQRHLFAATEHFELPGRPSANPWLQAFAWIRGNTPQNEYFALDPRYMAAPGEDYHSFRALAERSILADTIKDTSVLSKAPELVPVWKAQVDAQLGWNDFTLADFERLKQRFGVTWVVVRYPQPASLPCPWHNSTLAVCCLP
ncbi:MAG TPA: hypothetical protein VG267_05310 [Terracidiphilus sp.]|nr:hypothetical protein [Terracidiphilus sp.]